MDLEDIQDELVSYVLSTYHDDLFPGLAEGEEGGVDQMVDGQVSELIHKIIPAHPESEDRSVSCFLYLMSYRFLRALQKCLKRYRFI